MKRSCFWDMGTTLRVPGSPDHSRAAKWKEEKERKKEKARDDPKEPKEHFFFGDKQPQDPEWWQEEGLCLVVRRKERQEGLVKRPWWRLHHTDKEQTRTFPKTNAEKTIRKEKVKKKLTLNPDSQLQKHQMKKDVAMPGNQTICPQPFD